MHRSRQTPKEEREKLQQLLEKERERMKEADITREKERERELKERERDAEKGYFRSLCTMWL